MTLTCTAALQANLRDSVPSSVSLFYFHSKVADAHSAILLVSSEIRIHSKALHQLLV